MISELVARYLRRVRIDDVMAHLTRIAEHDRYQASLGIERAADLIAGAAQAIGLVDVTVEHFTADGATTWWTFQAPRAWTPTTARLDIRADGRSIVAVDHATQPFTIATYSAPTPAAGLRARVVPVRDDVGSLDLAGAVAVLGAADFARPDVLLTLAARGAVGFITDATSRGPSGEHPGRIELDARTSLFGFSVTAQQRAAIEAAAAAEAHVQVDIDRSARMPVVTGVLRGRGAGEVWLTSHLCHPRPGANDNASGAAALLGVAAALADRERDRSVRFVWGPEFLGVAALLHQRDARIGREGRPIAVINLDMVGEDPAQCGVPLVVERAPDWCRSLVTPVAERVVEEAFAQTSAHAGTWRPGLFFGFSDHALFANVVDPDGRSPAVQLWHPGDPFNHSAADTLDKVSPIQMLRATTAGAVLADIFASATLDEVSLEPVVERWCEREDADAATVAARYRDVDNGAWSRRLVEHVRAQNVAMRALVPEGPTATQRPRQLDTRAFAGRWQGPFNYRGVLADLSASRRADVLALFAADKRNYAVLTHLAMLCDVDAASLALRAPIDPATADILWSALLESGWVTKTDALRPAFRSYEAIDPAAPEGDTLNLAWTRDERECLSVDLASLLAAELRDEAESNLPYLHRYLVRDPYGEETVGPAIAAAFELPALRGNVTCGAGVVSLLHGLARLVASGAVRIVGDTYPDFPYYVANGGGTCAASLTAAVWFLERPSLIGDAFAARADLGALCEDAARHGAIVIVDESNANYYPPSWSAVGLALAHDNLAVIRGFSKAYGLGGLRLGYCVASPALTERIRTTVAPLLASSLSLRLGARVLALGDLTEPLRMRIHAHKRAVVEALGRAGVDALVPSSEHLPYVLSRATAEQLRAHLETRGVAGKHHPMWSEGRVSSIYRVSIPLSAARLARFKQLLP